MYISRRPRSDSPQSSLPDGAQAVKPERKASGAYEISNLAAYHDVRDDEAENPLEDHSGDDINYSMFDLNVDSIDVTLSLARWFDGKGLVEDAVVKGVRGVLGECRP